jgi:DNA (cytosine-5)-methyltransferase 1
VLTVGSLFSGIGGFDLGLERTGHMRTVWFCEQDEFCQRVLAKHWPGVPCHPDVRALVADADGAGCSAPSAQRCDSHRLRSAGAVGSRGSDGALPVPVPYVDVLCGGFPCQDLSYAGKGAGLDGERSGLWGEYARLIRELRPRYVVVENVSALLARGLGRVLGDLAACGYDAEWDCIPASAVGAPHRRDRVWLVAYPGGDDGRSGRAGRPASGRAGEPVAIGALQVADAALKRIGQCGWLERAQGGDRAWHLHHWLVEPDVGRVADELSAGLDGCRLDAERSRYQEARAAGASHAEAMRAVREHGTPTSPPPGLLEAGGDHRGLREVPSGARRGGRDQADEEAEGLHGLRRDVHELQPLAGQDLLEAMSQRSWPPSGHEALGWWDTEPPVGRVARSVPHRVDRLRSLGNALVPQIAEWLGRRILEWEGLT